MDIEKINVGGTQYDVCDTVARAAVSDEFSTGATYAAGDYCIYENTLYKFTAAKEPGAWDSSKVAATQISDELSQLNGNMNDLFITKEISLSDIVVPANGVKYQWETFPAVDGYTATDFFVTTGSPHIMCSYNDGSLEEHGVTVVLRNFSSSPITTGESAILHVILCRTGFIALS